MKKHGTEGLVNLMRDRMIELLFESELFNGADGKADANSLADHLLANGVIVPPCKVGDVVYYINTRYHIALYRNRVYEAKVARIVVTTLGVALVIQIRDESGCCEIPDVKDFGKTVFLTREEAEQALKGEHHG